MRYNIVYSAEARQDLRNIYQYIAYELLESGVASAQVDRIMKAVVNVVRIMYGGRDIRKQLIEL